MEENRGEASRERQKAMALEHIREELLRDKCSELQWPVGAAPVEEWGSERNSWRAVSEESVKGKEEVASSRGCLSAAPY